MLMTVAWNNDSVEERFAGKVYQESVKDAVASSFMFSSAIEKKIAPQQFLGRNGWFFGSDKGFVQSGKLKKSQILDIHTHRKGTFYAKQAPFLRQDERL